MLKSSAKPVLLIFGLLLIGACSLLEPTPKVELILVEVTPTASPTMTSTSTPTPTPTPTATSPPIQIIGDLRYSRISTPSPQFGAQCGVVDILDFPLKPPDAIGTRGGRDFGVFRGRYNGYHTGEDWGISGGSNFGESVYSIGHGVVTHAHPNGWGEDKGTVIIKHSFDDGSVIYSFYGHLDPPSVTLLAGQCVTRGEKIGEIGRPRTPPHLHFEIRAVFPDQPARGYLPYDPEIAGWKHPSKFIHQQRIESSPGVIWMKEATGLVIEGVGLIEKNTFIVKQDQDLAAINLSDGSSIWTHPLPRSAIDIEIDLEEPILYVIDRSGRLEAFSLPDSDTSGNTNHALEASWSVELSISGNHELIPLPGGGVILSTNQGLIGISAEGDMLWEENTLTEMTWWSMSGDSLLLTVDNEQPSIWQVSSSTEPQILLERDAKVLKMGSEYLFYSESGLSMYDPESGSVREIYQLPQPDPGIGSMIQLPNGSALIVHTDIYDRRLIEIGMAGDLQWEKSYADYGSGEADVFLSDYGPIITVRKIAARFGVISALILDEEKAEMMTLFEGGPVSSFPAKTWAHMIDGKRLLLNIGGSWMVLIDIQLALEAVITNPN